LVANLELLKGEEVVVSRPIRTRAVPEGATTSDDGNVVSIPLVILIQDSYLVAISDSGSLLRRRLEVAQEAARLAGATKKALRAVPVVLSTVRGASGTDAPATLWFGQDRKQETLDEFFRTQLRTSQRKRIEALEPVKVWLVGPKTRGTNPPRNDTTASFSTRWQWLEEIDIEKR
jgi:hypothetical protein